MHQELYLNQKQTNETVKAFYQCTNIPIRFYASNHLPIASYGFNEEFSCLIEEYHIYRQLKKKLSESLGTSSFETIEIENTISFTGVLSCPMSLDQGIYILGPYLGEMDMGINIPYKPKKFISNLVALLHSISKSCEIVDTHQTSGNISYSTYVKKAMDFMYANYQECITLEDISKHVNVNKCYFCSLFKKEVNKTVTQFLNEIRIDRSKELLVKDGISMLDVALNVGFNNQNYYNMSFKKLTGTTPLEYKRNTLGI